MNVHVLSCRYGTDSQIEFFKMLDKKIQEVKQIEYISSTLRGTRVSHAAFHRDLISMKNQELMIMKEPDCLQSWCNCLKYSVWSLNLALPS